MSDIAQALEGNPRYRQIKTLGEGAFGCVQLAYDEQDKCEVAIKLIPRAKVDDYVAAEINNQRQLFHPHVIMLKQVFLTDKYLAVVMEYANGGDMLDYVCKKGGLSELEARWFFQQLIIAVDYCHQMGVVNRDIKLENSLVHWSRKPLLKLCDFGYSKDEKYQSAPKSKVGTAAYLAPEVILNNERHGQAYNGKLSDVWSCGVMLFVMLVGSYPFEREEDKRDPQNKLARMLQRILRVEYIIPSHVQLSAGCRDLLSNILVADPNKRLSIPQIMQHPWFKQDLTDATLTMNERIMQHQRPPDMQTAENIKNLIRVARQRPEANPDQWVDDMLAEEMSIN